LRVVVLAKGADLSLAPLLVAFLVMIGLNTLPY